MRDKRFCPTCKGMFCMCFRQNQIAGMESMPVERAQARAEAEGQELTAEMKQPGKSISKKAGRIEREAPLFWGTGDNPTLFNGQ